MREDPPPSTTAPLELSGTRFFLAPLGGSLERADVDLGDLIERTGDAVILIDSQDVIRFWNQGAEAMFQYPRTEVVGRRIGFLMPADLREAGELEWIRSRLDEDGSLCNFVTRRVRKDGVERWVSLTRSVLHDTRGRVLGSSAVFRDVTEERQVQDELARARGMAIVGEMSVTLAHEIKNRLAGIYSAIQLFARKLAPGDPGLEVLQEATLEVKRLDETARDLVRFARPGPPRLESIDVAGFLAAAAAHLDLLEEVRMHPIEREVSPGLVVFADAELLGQAVQNLILNAAQAASRGGAIRIEAEQVGEWIQVSVVDSGAGIPENLLTSIFQPFFTTKARGTGLGLCIARKNVEAHGGRIEVASRPGKGSRFTIWLPAASDRVRTTGASSSP
ncbi:MAG: two-component system sensor histidine kinase NtrB [Planctomycetota bacterium]